MHPGDAHCGLIACPFRLQRVSYPCKYVIRGHGYQTLSHGRNGVLEESCAAAWNVLLSSVLSLVTSVCARNVKDQYSDFFPHHLSAILIP